MISISWQGKAEEVEELLCPGRGTKMVSFSKRCRLDGAVLTGEELT